MTSEKVVLEDCSEVLSDKEMEAVDETILLSRLDIYKGLFFFFLDLTLNILK